MLTTDGTERRITRYGRTYEEAHRKLVELQAQHHQGVPVAVSDLTVGDYLEQWLRAVVARKRPQTYVGYRDVVRLHLSPVLGRKKLIKLSAQDVRRLIAHTEQKCVCCVQGLDARRDDRERRCCAIGRYCGRRLGPRMVQFVHAVLRNALQNAVREELVVRNVAKLVQISNPDYHAGRGLSLAEAHRVLTADPSKFDFYAMDCYRIVGEDRLSEVYAHEVIRTSGDPDGTVRKPMRIAEAHIALGVASARNGDLDQAVTSGLRALEGERRSLPSLLMYSQELAHVLRERYHAELETAAFIERIQALRRP